MRENMVIITISIRLAKKWPKMNITIWVQRQHNLISTIRVHAQLSLIYEYDSRFM